MYILCLYQLIVKLVIMIEKWHSDIRKLEAYLGIKINQDWQHECFDFLNKHYTQKHRTYHNFKHINECLEWINQLNNNFDAPILISFCAWFHDLVYEPQNEDNETRSATLAHDKFKDINENFANQLRGIIILTEYKKFDHSMFNKDMKLFYDIDHFSFAKPYKDFAKDSENLRIELQQTNNHEYQQNRKEFLTKLLNKKGGFFLSEHFRNQYESVTKNNIIKAINELDN